MKNNLSKTSTKRASKKFNTSIKKPSSLLSNKLRKSMQENTTKTNNVKSSFSRKSALIPKSKALDKKKSLGSQKNITSQSSKRMSTSSQLKADNLPRKSKKLSIKERKSTKKSIQLDQKINNLKESQNLDINTLNSENNTKELNSEENSKTNEIGSNKSKSNQDNEKRISISSKNDNIKERPSKVQNKKETIKENRISNNNEMLKNKIKNELNDPNKYININLVKETNEKPNYRYNYDVNLESNIENQETRLRNFKVETSDYITQKNKCLIRNLLYLLDKKPDDKKSTKNFFRQSLNALNLKEENRILENLNRNKSDIFRIKQDEKLNHINQVSADKKLTDIYHNLFDHDYARNRFRSVENNYQTPFYKEKYFFNYVDGVHPNMHLILRENNENILREKNNSVKNANRMKKNDLIVEKRANNRYLGYNYNFMLNSIDNKLIYDYRDIYRRKRMQKVFDSINEDIYYLNPYHDNILRKTFSERNKSALYL